MADLSRLNGQDAGLRDTSSTIVRVSFMQIVIITRSVRSHGREWDHDAPWTRILRELGHDDSK